MKINTDIKEILQRVKYALKLDTWKDVADYLGVSEATLSAWKVRNSKSAVEKALYRAMEDINEEFLLTGDGPALKEKPPETKMEYPEKSAAKVLHDANNPVYQHVDEEGNVMSIFGRGGEGVHEVPIISWTRAGDFADIVDPYQPGQAEQWVLYPGRRSPHMFALVVRGDSMEPEFCEGDIIVVDPDRQAVTGDYVIAKTTNGNNEAGESTLKQFYQDVGSVLLKPLNYKYPIRDMTGVRFQIVGVVVWKMKGY